MGETKVKVNKKDFLNRVSRNHAIPLDQVKDVYSAIVEELESVVCAGHELSLTGFGTFALKKHKGHPVQFEAKTETVNDYVVLKFTASDVLMSKIRDAYSKGVASALK